MTASGGDAAVGHGREGEKKLPNRENDEPKTTGAPKRGPEVTDGLHRALDQRFIAVCGFDDPAPIVDALERADARVELVAGGSLARFEAAVVAHEKLSLFEVTETPLLLVGPIEAWESGAGKTDFMVGEPLNTDELLVRVYRLIGAGGQRDCIVAATPVVLTADDDPTTTAIVNAVVTQAGMTCHVAPNGRKALELAREIQPDVILLDVNMPYLDGFEVLSTLRSDPRTASIPVLMLTSVQQEPDVLRGFNLGADDYVAKPFNPLELLARVQRLVRRS